ncbi:MAG: hypothetical protein KME27_06790 [Lyngbya sp. HA4199-MV5]|jgi:hypothetical protein|nr:hypothetical protein [Lyngbya sp. HA4199-MV5]
MTNVLYLNDRHELEQHQNSIMASLAHRLDVARANNNAHLVALLERERQQVAPKSAASTVPTRHHWWTALSTFVVNRLFGGSELQVCEIVDGRDRWWVASNPQTGELVYADSEAELRLWIEENYQGR